MSTAGDAPHQADVVGSVLDSLGERERAAAMQPFDGEGRSAWSYLPGDRVGVALHELPRVAQQEVLRLLATVLRSHAVAQVAAVMALEDVLDLAEGGAGRRHRGDYWLTVFGQPGNAAWGWRFEGHHVSVNLTVAGDRVRAVPLFLGANPAAVRHREATVLRPFAAEDDRAVELLACLDPQSRHRAVVDGEAPPDIRTGRRAVVDGFPEDGVAGAELAPEGRQALRALASVYLDRLVPALAADTTSWLDAGGWDELRFQWRGPTDAGTPHYYALTGARLLVEYDNAQNDPNHVHTVLRVPGQDFGADVLAEHWARHH